MPNEYHLEVPLPLDVVDKLQIDDEVYLSGAVYTMMYESHFTKIMDCVRRTGQPPFALEGGVIYNTGTIFKRKQDGGYDFRAIGATTSAKFNALTPDFIRLTNVRAVIGKGGMNDEVLSAMKEKGCVYLSVAGGCSAIYTKYVEELEKEYWPQPSWSDNLLRLRLKNFGPLFVAMDSHGNSVYSEVNKKAEKMRPIIYRSLDI